MHLENLAPWSHRHDWAGAPHEGERRTRWVVGITLVMMVGEIVAGTAFNSMALLADGWHMGTHAAALGVAAFAYSYARRHAGDPRYTFGTGKVGALGGFASAVVLAVVALLVLGESASRLGRPVPIRFDDAIAVAVLGLLVNLACALLLREDHGDGHGHHQDERVHAHDQVHDHDHDQVHGHGHDHDHVHGHDGREVPRHHDHNLRAAYMHVVADALTSVLAIVALVTGRSLGWWWMDPVMGVVGSLVIARWSWGLLRDAGEVLLDAEIEPRRRAEIVRAIEADGDNRVSDLHVWRVGPRELAAIVCVVTHAPRDPAHYRGLLVPFADLAHVTVEVIGCAGVESGSRGPAARAAPVG